MIRLEKGFRAAGLAWPAEIVVELVQHYGAMPPGMRFDPARVAELAGELLIRCDAIRSGTRAVPQLLVWVHANRATEIGSTLHRLGVRRASARKGVEITAYLGFGLRQHRRHRTRFSGSAQGVPTCPGSIGSSRRRQSSSISRWPRSGGPVVAPGRQALRRPPARAGPRPASANPQGFAWEALARRWPRILRSCGRGSGRCRPHRCGRGTWQRACTCTIARVEAFRYNPAGQGN